MHLYIFYEPDTWIRDLIMDFILGSCLFETVKSTKNVDPHRYGYSVNGIGFDTDSQFRKKNVLVPNEGRAQGLNDSKLTAEANYSVNFTRSGRRFVLSLYYNGSNIFLFATTVKCIDSKL